MKHLHNCAIVLLQHESTQDLNPDPEFLQAVCPHFPEVEPPQAETNNDGPKGDASQTKEIIAPNGGVIKMPKEQQNSNH
ncbi:hypothetical protein DSO57_1005464 [Entomophthora muscae]|uniref:Uncharacterized protein n=1 Tax=Entomophthora muscae TaxID=34485 RepID=A0ACC2T7R6_9FUNG|nr:hypothetical protein DSO57_1005464 [Entomophthora muscae]